MRKFKRKTSTLINLKHPTTKGPSERLIRAQRRNTMSMQKKYRLKGIYTEHIPTPLDPIIPNKGVATSIYNVINGLPEGFTYWVDIINRFINIDGIDALMNDWVNWYFHSGDWYTDDNMPSYNTKYNEGADILKMWENIVEREG